uniref:Uncharacterized protein n=1 Tax=Chrysemys picta bellii TaxID=8478 RepID=A0A8C3H5W5_CHRPI
EGFRKQGDIQVLNFQSLDISCNPRDTVDAHLLHPTSLYLLHALAHNVSLLHPLHPTGHPNFSSSFVQLLLVKQLPRMLNRHL